MSRERRDQRELFLTPEDIVAAHQLVEAQLGVGLDVNLAGLPKSVGAKGDEGVRGASVVIWAPNQRIMKRLVDEAHDIQQEGSDRQSKLDKLMGEICGTTSACRVLLDITPGDVPFEIDH